MRVKRHFSKHFIYLMIVGFVFACYTTAFASLSDGLVAYWSFDNCDVTDNTGNGYDGTLYGIPGCLPGKESFALNFDGEDDHVKLNKTLATNDIKAFSFWIYSKGIDGINDRGIIIAKYNWSGKRSFRINCHDGKATNRIDIAFDPVGTGNEWDTVKSYYEDPSSLDLDKYTIINNTELTTKTWTHVVVNMTTTEISIWINGMITNKVKRYYQHYFDSSEPVYMGNAFRYGEGSNNRFNGLLDEFRIYNRDLSEDEIQELYSNDPPSPCTSDEECDDGLFCNGAEICVEGMCQPGNAPCPDDGLYCNGKETCDEGNDECVHGGDPCMEDTTCNEDTDSCDPDDTSECTLDAECDDGLFCNGAERCVEGMCQPGNAPCPDDGFFCNGDESCDEVNDECVHSGDPCPEGTTCNDTTNTCTPNHTPTECSADFIASPLFGCAPLEVHFTELCEGDVVSYKWDFGDGKTSTEPNPTHTYPIGTFSPSLTCTSSDGSSDTEIKGNLIWASPYCPLVCSLKSTAEVNILRNLREHILNESIFGPIVVNLYYQHAAEVSEILYECPEFKEKLRDLVGRHINAVNGVIKGRKVSLSEHEVDEIMGFLHDLKEEGSSDLVRDVSIVIKALQGGYFLQGLGVSIE